MCLQTSTSETETVVQKESYVKWKGKSYMHCSWVPFRDIQSAANLPHMPNGARAKLRKILYDSEVVGKTVRSLTVHPLQPCPQALQHSPHQPVVTMAHRELKCFDCSANSDSTDMPLRVASSLSMSGADQIQRECAKQPEGLACLLTEEHWPSCRWQE